MQPPEEPTAANGKAPTSVVMQILGVVAAGIGVLGFVTFFGGAILWVRAREGGLPASETVAVVPKPVFVATGASFLVPAALIVLGVVGLFYAVHLGLRIFAGGDVRELGKSVDDLQRKAAKAKLEAAPKSAFAIEARALADRTRGDFHAHENAATELARIGEDTSGLAGSTARLTERMKSTEMSAQAAERAARDAEQTVARLEDEADRAAVEQDVARRTAKAAVYKYRWVEYAFAFVLLLGLPLLLDQGAVFQTSLAAMLVLLALAVATIVLCYVAYYSTDRFVWFALIAFAGASAFLSAETYFRTQEHPKFQPAAALREDRAPAIGWLVAETSRNVYIGTFRGRTAAPRLQVIPRAQVSDLAVGPLLPPDTAFREAILLARRLCNDRSERCSPAQVARLRRQSAIFGSAPVFAALVRGMRQPAP